MNETDYNIHFNSSDKYVYVDKTNDEVRKWKIIGIDKKSKIKEKNNPALISDIKKIATQLFEDPKISKEKIYEKIFSINLATKELEKRYNDKLNNKLFWNLTHKDRERNEISEKLKDIRGFRNKLKPMVLLAAIEGNKDWFETIPLLAKGKDLELEVNGTSAISLTVRNLVTSTGKNLEKYQHIFRILYLESKGTLSLPKKMLEDSTYPYFQHIYNALKDLEDFKCTYNYFLNFATLRNQKAPPSKSCYTMEEVIIGEMEHFNNLISCFAVNHLLNLGLDPNKTYEAYIYNPNLQSWKTITLLTSSRYYKNHKLTDLLLERGAKPEQKKGHDSTRTKGYEEKRSEEEKKSEYERQPDEEMGILVHNQRFNLTGIPISKAEEEIQFLKGNNLEDCELYNLIKNRLLLGERGEELFKMPDKFFKNEDEMRRTKLFYNALRIQIHPDKIKDCNSSEVFKAVQLAWEKWQLLLKPKEIFFV